jgi:hypothetical protein
VGSDHPKAREPMADKDDKERELEDCHVAVLNVEPLLPPFHHTPDAKETEEL